MKIHSPIVTGSLSVSPSLTVTGTIEGTASLASTASQAQTASSADGFTIRQGLTGSSALFTGAITAQTLVVQTVTSSIVYSSGSNRFGNQLTDVQEMTGSLRVTGSGDHYIVGGNVGIGTTSSFYALSIKSSDANANRVQLLPTTNFAFYQIDNSAGTTYIGTDNSAGGVFGNGSYAMSIYNSYAGSINMYTNALLRMTISGSNGNVGIGTTTPDDKLDVNGGNSGAATFRNTYFFANDNYAIRIVGDTTKYGYISQYVNDGNLVLASGMRYYGAGPWTPDSTNAESIQLYNGDIYFTTNAGLTAGVNFTPTTRMFISSSGNVGIGTTSPSALLHLSSGTPYLYLDDTSTSGTRNRFQILNGDVGATQSVTFGFNNTSGTNLQEVITFNENGNVGIGTTSPSVRLDVTGSSAGNYIAKFRNASATGYGIKINPGGDAYEALRISNAADTADNIKLYGDGNASFAGTVSIGGSQITQYTSGVQTDPTQNTWYTVYTFAEFELTAFFLMVGFENNNGDGSNLTAIFVDSGATSYGGGFSTTRLTGSTTLEAQRGTGFTLQIRTTGTAGTSTKLRWNLIRIDGD